jgi:urease accessory protein UreH
MMDDGISRVELPPAEVFPFGRGKASLAFSKDLRRGSTLSLFEITTTTEEIRDGVVALY